MNFVSFASGSSGNCYLLTEGRTAVLIDAGISLRRIKTGLARRSLTPDDLAGVLITHEHTDHTAGLAMLLKYHKNVKVYAPQAVAHVLERAAAGLEGRIVPIPVRESVALKNFTLTAFPTMHDTPESVGYVLAGKNARFGVCTDTGCVTAEMLDALAGCDAAVIEANHDIDMLRTGRYPVYLKRRILSERGHLSNEDCAKLACALAKTGVKTFVLGHLSRENNRPRLAETAVREALDGECFSAVTLCVAPAEGDLELEVTPCCASN